MRPEQSSLDRQLDDITLYPTEPDPVLAAKVRQRLGKVHRSSIFYCLLWLGVVALLCWHDGRVGVRDITGLVVLSVFIVFNVIFLGNIKKSQAKRVIKVGKRSLRDCLQINTPRDNVGWYSFSQMRHCVKTDSSLEITMADGRTLEIPAKAFAHQADFDNFAVALSEQKNVPVIDRSNQEVAGVS